MKNISQNFFKNLDSLSWWWEFGNLDKRESRITPNTYSTNSPLNSNGNPFLYKLLISFHILYPKSKIQSRAHPHYSSMVWRSSHSTNSFVTLNRIERFRTPWSVAEHFTTFRNHLTKYGRLPRQTSYIFDNNIAPGLGAFCLTRL